jgi:lipopolysaccharide export system permease protein
MRLLDRYLFRELLTPLAFCLGGLLILGNCFSLFGELQDFQDHKLRLLDIIEYTVAITPEFLVLVLPITLLLAMLYALTNHTRYNEITAMRAAGISLWRICAPYFVVGCVLSVILFGLNELVVPRSIDWAEHIKTRYVPDPDNPDTQTTFSKLGFVNARSHRKWLISQYNLKTHEMLKPIVSWDLPDGSSQELYADRAIRTNGVWTFFNVAEYAKAATNATSVPLFPTNLPALAMPDFDETPRQIQSEIKITSYQSIRNARRSDIPLADILAYLRLHPNLPRKDSSWLFTKFQGRLALPWTCLVVVLVAIPFGAAPGRRNLFVGVAGSIFICFAYFVIQQISIQMGSHGVMSAWLAAWLPNMIFGAMGLILMVRVR